MFTTLLPIPSEARHEYGIHPENWDELPRAEALIVAVAHQEYGAMPQPTLLSRVQEAGVVIDVKSSLSLPAIRGPGFLLLASLED